LRKRIIGWELFHLRAGNPKYFKVNCEKDILKGIVAISFTGKKEKDWHGNSLYRRHAESEGEDRDIAFIPFASTPKHFDDII
jgi:hypothetical protein